MVWFDDAVTAGAFTGSNTDSWSNWVTANPVPFSGTRAIQSAVASGVRQLYFFGATTPLSIAVGDTLFAYVYLDPANPPSQVMLQWHDVNGSWGHRAYWGATDATGWGGSARGALPATGQWVRLEVPASAVWLEGMAINGQAFTLSDGRATWDKAGKSTVSSVAVAPAITSQPASVTVAAGQTATFTVATSGTAPLSYQWKLGSTNVGTNSATLTIANAQAANVGSYTCVVSNSNGSATSNAANLTVNVFTPSGNG